LNGALLNCSLGYLRRSLAFTLPPPPGADGQEACSAAGESAGGLYAFPIGGASGNGGQQSHARANGGILPQRRRARRGGPVSNLHASAHLCGLGVSAVEFFGSFCRPGFAYRWTFAGAASIVPVGTEFPSECRWNPGRVRLRMFAFLEHERQSEFAPHFLNLRL